MSVPDELVADFVSVTGSDPQTAKGILQACNLQLDSAVQLYFETQAGTSTTQTDAELASSLQQSSRPGMLRDASTSAHGEDEVRAPIPIKKDTLYGDAMPQFLRHQARSRSHNQSQPQGLNAFRDFQAEMSGRGGTNSTQGLASLFKAPAELLFHGSFEEAKAKAMEEGKWLMVNVQSNDQFGSHQLNRDTWSDATVAGIIMGSFVFWQVYDSSDSGSRFMNSYRISSVHELPATIIIDPITGAKQRQLTGFIEPERLAEDLVPFMDHDIHHPAAHKLAQHKRKQTLPRAANKKVMTEDEELALALAMSVEGNEPAASSGAGPAHSLPETAEPSAGGQQDADAMPGVSKQENTFAAANGAAQGPDEASVMADAEARLPSEPDKSDPSLCRVAIRLPSGGRLQRTFSKEDPVSALHDFCIVKAEGAAGKPFQLVQAFPGAPPLADASLSIDAAGLANGVVALKWST